MSDPWSGLSRTYLEDHYPEAIAVVEKLVAERDEANADWHRMRDLHADALTEIERLREGFEFSCQCGKSYVFSPPSDPRNQDDNPHPDAEDDA